MLFIILLILQTSFHQSCLIIINIFIRTNSTWFGKRLFLVWEDKQSFIIHKIYETLFSLTWRIVRFYTGHFRVLIPEKYESRIQLKESGIPLTIDIRNPSATGKESEIQDLLIWTPEFRTMTGIRISDSLESRIQDYLESTLHWGRKKWHSLIVESSPRFWCCIWHWFNLDFSSKRGDTSCFLWGPYCLSVLCPDLVPRSPSDLWWKVP